ncbi:ABC transporter permease, partial [Rhizobiaceae sp. 2RAB30]
QDYLTVDRTFTLENYRVALTEPIYRDLLFRSLYVSLVVSVLTVVLAYPIAYFISFHGGPHKALWLFLITIPFWTSYLLRVMSWKVILGYNGVLNSGLLGLGIIDEPSTALLYNTSAVIITLTHAWAAFAILPIFVSLEKVDRTLLEAATDLGDGPIRRFLRVTLPLSIPGVIGAMLIVMIPTVGDYVTPKMVGGKDGVMISTAIQTQFLKGANWPLGAALSVATMAAVTAMAVATVFLIRSTARLAR